MIMQGIRFCDQFFPHRFLGLSDASDFVFWVYNFALPTLHIHPWLGIPKPDFSPPSPKCFTSGTGRGGVKSLAHLF